MEWINTVLLNMCIWLVFTFSGTGQADEISNNLKSLQVEAQNNFAAGKYEEAINLYDKIIQNYPDDLESIYRAYLSKGESQIRLKSFQQAKDTYTDIYERFKDTNIVPSRQKVSISFQVRWLVPVEIGRIYVMQNQFDLALVEYNKSRDFLNQKDIWSKYPPDIRTKLKFQYSLNSLFGEVYRKKGMYDLAIHEFQEFIAFASQTDKLVLLPEKARLLIESKRDFDYQLQIADCYREQKKYQKALNLYRSILNQMNSQLAEGKFSQITPLQRRIQEISRKNLTPLIQEYEKFKESQFQNIESLEKIKELSRLLRMFEYEDK